MTTATIPVTCPICAREFKTARALSTHTTRTHKESTMKNPLKSAPVAVVETPKAETPAPKAKKTKTLSNCACAGWVAMIPSGDAISPLKGAPKAHRAAAEYDAHTTYTMIELDCTQTTASTFAPGHDARFKGLCITAQRFGGEMMKDGSSMSPSAAIMAVSPGLLEFLPMAPVQPAA